MDSRSSNIDLSKLLSPESLERAIGGVREMLARQKACERRGHVEGALLSDSPLQGYRRVQCSRCGDTYKLPKTHEESRRDYESLNSPMTI